MTNEIKTGKILVGIPYHSVKDYCLPEAFKTANALTYPDKEIVLRFDPSEYGSENAVKKQREFFRNLCLDKDFEWLYFMGVDTIPPVDVLERLIKTANANNIKVIGGVYFGRKNAGNGTPDGAVAWIHSLPKEEQTQIFKTVNALVEVDGMGMDCVLIHREVLEKISFMSWFQNDDDYPFYDKAKEAGYKIFMDTGIQCKHYFSPTGYTQAGEIFE